MEVSQLTISFYIQWLSQGPFLNILLSLLRRPQTEIMGYAQVLALLL